MDQTLLEESSEQEPTQDSEQIRQTLIARVHLIKGMANSINGYEPGEAIDPANAVAAEYAVEEELALVYMDPVKRFGVDTSDLNADEQIKFREISTQLLTYPQDVYSDPDKKDFYEQHKEKFTKVAGEYYGFIETNLDPEYVASVEQAAASRIREHAEENNIPHALLVNGVVTAGKGTTLSMLNGLSALETGTDGIVGAQGDYAVFSDIIGSFDPLRDAGKLVPDKVMRLLLAQGIEWWMNDLDKTDKPFTMSGFPRTTDQAQNGILRYLDADKIASVYLYVPEEEAITRTLSRLMELQFKGEHVRPDDLGSLNTTEGKPISIDWLQTNLFELSGQTPGGICDEQQLAHLVRTSNLAQKAKFSPQARYPRDVKRGSQTNESLENALGISTTVINGFGKTKRNVTESVAEALEKTVGYSVNLD